jgi:NAD(P)H-dependent FMN reductase
MFKAATVLSYGVQGGLLAAEHLRGVLAELNVVTIRRVVGLRAPWDDVDAAGFASPPG